MIKQDITSFLSQNIKDKKIVQDLAQVFVEIIDELNPGAENINGYYGNPTKSLKERLVQQYMNDMYRILTNIGNDIRVAQEFALIEEITGVKIDLEVLADVATFIQNEDFYTARTFKEKKGTLTAIKYAYEMVNNVVNKNIQTVPFEIEEIDAFTVKLSGAIPASIYEVVVKPLAQPLGFVYRYVQAFLVRIEEYYSKVLYKNTDISIDYFGNITNRILIDGTKVIDINRVQKATATYTYLYFSSGDFLDWANAYDFNSTNDGYTGEDGDFILATDDGKELIIRVINSLGEDMVIFRTNMAVLRLVYTIHTEPREVDTIDRFDMEEIFGGANIFFNDGVRTFEPIGEPYASEYGELIRIGDMDLEIGGEPPWFIGARQKKVVYDVFKFVESDDQGGFNNAAPYALYNTPPYI
jgi:hypothetical protein